MEDIGLRTAVNWVKIEVILGRQNNVCKFINEWKNIYIFQRQNYGRVSKCMVIVGSFDMSFIYNTKAL